MDFSWLSSDRETFAWLVSTETESYKPEVTFDGMMSVKLYSAVVYPQVM